MLVPSRLCTGMDIWVELSTEGNYKSDMREEDIKGMINYTEDKKKRQQVGRS